MSKDDSSGGFLSKVVKFVRHPTTSWADLDTRAADRESEYSKAALKEIIERKRRNDFVRKREFDQLRKIRSREASGQEGQSVRPSFFQSSLPSKPDDRATTLKKINEIEAQMSMQWWKTKSPDSLVTGSSTLSSGGQPSKMSPAPPRPKPKSDEQGQRRQQQYKDTEVGPMSADTVPMSSMTTQPQEVGPGSAARPPAPFSAGPGKSAATPTPPPGASSPARTGLMAPTGSGEASGANALFSASHFFALDVQEVAQDPEVEEAAIRFANGDDAGAEKGLLDTLDTSGNPTDQLQNWLTLFDLYRATGQLTPFENRAVEFINRFSRSAPQWYDMPEIVRQLSGKPQQPSASASRAVWVSEPDLDAHAVGTLQTVLLRVGQPWVLDWTLLATIDVKAARALLGVFTLWGDQEVSLAFLGASEFRELLKSLTPSGRRDVEQLWWELRMAVLRVMNCPDEFELTALDFCVTYEVSPPGWESPRCTFQALSASGPADAGDFRHSLVGHSVLEAVPSGFPADSGIDSQVSEFSQVGLVELSGEIRGDPQETLQALERRLTGADVLIISCRNLIRVDFSAAGTLLNWVSAHHAEGRHVQFVDAHRLVSAFFHVIGITEYAKVVLRND